MLTIPIYDTILLPDVTFYFRKEVIEGWDVSQLETGEEIAFAMLREDIDLEVTTLADVYPIGVIARIESIDSEGNVKVRTKERVSFLEFARDKDGNIDALLEPRADIDDLEEVVSKLISTVELDGSNKVVIQKVLRLLLIQALGYYCYYNFFAPGKPTTLVVG